MGLWEDQEDEIKPPGEKGEYCEKCLLMGKWIHFTKCPMCHKYICDACRFPFGGKDFCSQNCGNAFFWGTEEGEDDE